MLSSTAQSEVWTVYRCKANAEFDRANPEIAEHAPASPIVLWRCGDSAANVACDCEPIKVIPASIAEELAGGIEGIAWEMEGPNDEWPAEQLLARIQDWRGCLERIAAKALQLRGSE